MKKIFLVGMMFLGIATLAFAQDKQVLKLPKLHQKAVFTYAPEVPPPITRKEDALVEVELHSGRNVIEIKPGTKYEYWTFNEHVPGPFIRVRQGDTIEVHHTSSDPDMPHNIDFHAVTGPGGGAPVTTAIKGEESIAWFKMLEPGLYIYHCAAPPVMDHIANGMYGLILVEPKKGLPKVDHEYYVMQHEIYAVNPSSAEPSSAKGHDHMTEEKKDDVWGDEVGEKTEPVTLQFSHQNGLDEHPMFVFFNETVGALMKEGSLKAKVGDKVRVYFGNAGPNLISSFHIIGTIFKNVYREGDLISPPAHAVQTTLVPAGGSTVVDIDLTVPGTFTLVDHAIFRIEKGAVGYLQVEGKPNYDIYASDHDPVLCPGCLVHP